MYPHGLGCPRPVMLQKRVPRGIKAALVIGVVATIGGRGGEAARRLAEFLGGVRKTIRPGGTRQGG